MAFHVEHWARGRHDSHAHTTQEANRSRHRYYYNTLLPWTTRCHGALPHHPTTAPCPPIGPSPRATNHSARNTTHQTPEADAVRIHRHGYAQ